MRRSKSLSRRKLLKNAGGASLTTLLGLQTSQPLPAASSQSPAGAQGPPAILPLTSTSEVVIPTRGAAFMKFSFDFPEPSVEFAGLRFGFRICTYENVYGLNPQHMTAEKTADGLEVNCSQLTWAGGQEKAPGTLRARLRQRDGFVEWDAQAEMQQPIKAVTVVLRGVPRGRLSSGGQPFFDPKDGEMLFGYPFSAGDLFLPNAARGMETPLILIESGERDFFFISSLDSQVRAKRFYFQPGEKTYRVDTTFETEGWKKTTRVQTPVWRAGRTNSLEQAMRLHYAHLERAYGIPDWESRQDVPQWLRELRLVVTLHGMGWTGYIFNDFASMRKISEWIASQIAPEKVLIFVPAWDGRYYWNYPIYRPDPRMGGSGGFRDFISTAHKLGFHVMAMFGTNAANRRLGIYSNLADASATKIDDEPFEINWVDWDRDGHQEGGIMYMNIGIQSWRDWLFTRISETIEQFGVDAYFLDIAGGWINNTKADMHEGTARLVHDLRRKYPRVLACGEMHYDALLSVFPLYQAFAQRAYPQAVNKYARTFVHLSSPAPGRGSSGVHEWGFSSFDETTLGLNDVQIPSLNVVDDTFERYRDVMAKVIRTANQRPQIVA